MTVGELKERLKNIPDDLEIISYQDTMEKHGIMKIYGIIGKVKKYRKERKETWDRFDGESYSYEVYVEDENGDIEAFEV